uniref:DUF7079 family protein n=1 Tax=Thaumasiovibrio occultus TaxID=1891184 RepID=UPI000B34FBF4|nr:hypothetical protein [Thaumasiovibrio occultus]
MSDKTQRLPIWRALSALFLDTEIDEATLSHIADTLYRCDVSPDDAEHILWHEVYPVLAPNLRAVAGVWDGWSDEWLLENLTVSSASAGLLAKLTRSKAIAQHWQHIVAVMDALENPSTQPK